MNLPKAPKISGTPQAEVEITEELVSTLLAAQHPDLAHLPVCEADVGWDNAMFRLGESLCVRLPRRQAAVPLIEREQQWLPILAAQLTLPAPIPQRVGVPAQVFPWRWSILPWLTGTPSDLSDMNASQSLTLAAFLLALHRPAPSDAPQNPWRGVPLSVRAAQVEERLARLAMKTDLITPALRAVWERALAAPLAEKSGWLHGDLHARNILVKGGAISGIIDWGDMTAGDAATDLAAFWMLFDDRATREAALQAYGADDATVQRARGWAVFFGVTLLDTGLIDNPRHAAMGERTLLNAAA